MVFGSRCRFVNDDVREKRLFTDNFFWEINSVRLRARTKKKSAAETRKNEKTHKGESVIMRYKYLISTVFLLCRAQSNQEATKEGGRT